MRVRGKNCGAVVFCPVVIDGRCSCGTPIVTSDANGLEEIAGDAALRVDPEDPAAISGAIHRVLTEPRLAAELSARGLERSKLFSWERCVRETLEILEGLDGAGARGLS